MAAPNSKRTTDTEGTFLTRYAETGTIGTAATAAGITRQTVRNWRKADPVFDELCKDAYDVYKEALHAEIHRRAVEGTLRPVFYQGEECGSIREYSDRMLELLAKRHMPEFRDRYQVDLTTAPGVLAVPGMGTTSREWEEQHRDQPAGPAEDRPN